MKEVQRIRDAAQATLDADRRGEKTRRLTADEVCALIDSLGGLLTVLRQAGPNDKCDVYRQLGVTISYQQVSRTATVEVVPRLPGDIRLAMTRSAVGVGLLLNEVQ
jgi:site-specific DNA recombinase